MKNYTFHQLCGLVNSNSSTGGVAEPDKTTDDPFGQTHFLGPSEHMEVVLQTPDQLGSLSEDKNSNPHLSYTKWALNTQAPLHYYVANQEILTQ